MMSPIFEDEAMREALAEMTKLTNEIAAEGRNVR